VRTVHCHLADRFRIHPQLKGAIRFAASDVEPADRRAIGPFVGHGCTGCIKNEAGVVTEVHATVFPGTKSGTAGADSVKAKAAITWVAVADGVSAQVRLYDRLFADAHPDAGGKDFLTSLNPNSLKVEFAHGDQPIFQWVPISQARDQSGGLEMREITSGTMWGLNEHGFSSLNEIGGLKSICVGKHARLPYPRGCAKP